MALVGKGTSTRPTGSPYRQMTGRGRKYKGSNTRDKTTGGLPTSCSLSLTDPTQRKCFKTNSSPTPTRCKGPTKKLAATTYP